jgi:DNA-binding response OmpR family regulator
VGELYLDINERSASLAGEPLILSQMEFALLRYLVENRGKVLRKEVLMNDVWGDSFSDPSTLTVHIRRLRSKIEKDSAHPSHIITAWGVGYKYVE